MQSGRAADAGRRDILRAAAGGLALAASGGLVDGLATQPTMAAAVDDELTWMPAWRMRQLIGAKKLSPVEVTDHFLARIDKFNGTLKAFKHLDEDGARDQARRAEAAVARGDVLGPLHGLPVSVKEHIAVAGMPVMAEGGIGEVVAQRDDIAVERLRAAGAVIVGTNTMMGTSSPSPGQFDWDAEAHSPWDPARSPGWSSSGGAAAAAARLLPVTIGSDGGGSTRLPAALTGVVGVHPSVGRVPMVSYSRPSLEFTVTLGPLAREVRDAAMFLQAMAGPDGRAFVTIESSPPDYLGGLDKGVAGMRLAWTDDYGFASMYALPQTPAVVAAVRQAALGFSRIGASVAPTSETWEDFWDGYVTTSTFYGSGSAHLATLPGPDQVRAALERRERDHARFLRLFAEHDLLLSPTIQFTAMKMEDWAANWTRNGAKFPHGTFAPTYTADTHMFNWLGFPAVTVPCGFVGGLPVGLQIVGLPDREAKIFQAASAFQRAFPRNERPQVS